ncbi:MAG: hypothetical protein IID61_09600 [SAR324 cluster bacterium]|nr:hypothetical protein [SAR324 cluster bacterium]
MTDYRTHESITFWPIFHFRMEFAAVVRGALMAAADAGQAPEVVAVELPGTWRESILQGVNRLPYLSLVLAETGEGHLYLPIEPTDACVEALRTARELGLQTELIDLDVDAYPFHRDPVPDSHPISRLGYDAVMEKVVRETRFTRHQLDEERETMMAHALQRLSAGGQRVDCVIGVAHLTGVMEKLNTPQPRPLARARSRDLRLYNWSEKSSREFLTEAPFLAAAYERARKRARPAEASSTTEKIAGGSPHFAAAWRLDREAESEALLREAVQAYADDWGDPVSPHKIRLLGHFAQKYARVEGMIVPDLYQLVVAARGVADDDLAQIVWERGSAYPWQDGSGLLPTIDLDETYAWIGARRLTLRHKIRRQRPRLTGISDRKRLKERFAGQWKSKWSGRVICSHVPEDLVVEDFGRYLQHKAKGTLSAEHTRVEPFMVSLKDGIDVRETLRNWHEGQLYVRDLRRISGDVGAVVVIFDEDRHTLSEPGAWDSPETDQYPWRVTWLGEHEQESDMALYATPAGENLVGPGISRCEYGGFMMSYPPGRMMDVWSDPFFDAARTKAERLLLAGLDYSQQRFVVYAAEKPPRTWFHAIAARMERQVVYIPLGSLRPATLRKIRYFHVLEGHSVRDYAEDYIR